MGQAVAEAFAASGSKVVLSSRKQPALDEVAEKIKAAGIALYLASSAYSFTTGSVFLIDGGQLVSQQIEFS